MDSRISWNPSVNIFFKIPSESKHSQDSVFLHIFKIDWNSHEFGTEFRYNLKILNANWVNYSESAYIHKIYHLCGDRLEYILQKRIDQTLSHMFWFCFCLYKSSARNDSKYMLTAYTERSDSYKIMCHPHHHHHSTHTNLHINLLMPPLIVTISNRFCCFPVFDWERTRARAHTLNPHYTKSTINKIVLLKYDKTS